MILTSGGRFGGYGFYLKDGKPVFLWNLVDLERIKWEGTEALAPGKHVVEFDFKYDGAGAGTLAFNDFTGVGKGGTGTLAGRRQGSSDAEDEADPADDPAMGRKLRHRVGHADRRERCRLRSHRSP